jgi:hypothetical protein
VAGTAIFVSAKGEIKKFVLGFFSPGLFGIYVFAAILGVIIFGVFYYGYGCWFRVGGFLPVIVIPTVCLLFLVVVFAGWLQTQIWKRLLKQPDACAIPLVELLVTGTIVTLVVLSLSAEIGAEVREAQARRICRDCNPLIAELKRKKNLHGIYPTNTVALVKTNTTLHHRYFFYYGQSGTNGIEWSADKIAEASISLFVATNSFQFVVPIEKMSPISFSSFYVYSYTSEHPFWDKTKLHWFLGGAFIDNPKQ